MRARKAPGGEGGGAGLLVALREGGVEERLLQDGEGAPLPRTGEDVLGRGEAGAAVERAGIPDGVVPAAGGLGEPAVRAQPLTVVVDPGAVARPRGDEGLVGEAGVLAVQGDQPCPGQDFEDAAGLGGSGAEFGAVGGAAGVGGALAGGDQAQQDLPRGGGLGGGEAGADLLGAACDGPVDFAGGPVRLQRRRTAAAPPPGLQQGVREQREAAGWSAASPTISAVSPRSTTSPAAAGPTTASRSSAGDMGPTSTVASRRAWASPACSAQRPKKSARKAITARSRLPGAHADGRRPRNAPRSPGSAPRVNRSSNWSTRTTVSPSPAAGSKARACEVGPGARGEDADGRRPPAGNARRAQGGDEPGAQQRRLAAARRADHRHQALAVHRRRQLRGERGPAEEQVRIAGFEPAHPRVGRCGAVLAGAGLRRDLAGRQPPPPLPLGHVAAAGPHVGQHGGERGQALAGCRL
ncbi:hypothetical protein SLH32_36490 [Streptomyces sp. KHY 26]